jgi:hypothetical protein
VPFNARDTVAVVVPARAATSTIVGSAIDSVNVYMTSLPVVNVF